MCAVCFTGFQAIPMAAVAGRAWWVKYSAMAAVMQAETFADEPESAHTDTAQAEAAHPEIEIDAERFVLA